MLVVELLLRTRETQVGRVEPHVISSLEIPGGALSLVILRLHSSCCFGEGFLGLLVDVGHGFCEVGSGGIREWSCSRRIGDDSRVSAIQYQERTFLCGAVDAVVVCELSEREPVTPICLSMIDKDSEVLLDLLVHSFGLSIGLWMKGGGRVWGNVEHSVMCSVTASGKRTSEWQ